jgi:hypothetical protein
MILWSGIKDHIEMDVLCFPVIVLVCFFILLWLILYCSYKHDEDHQAGYI